MTQENLAIVLSSNQRKILLADQLMSLLSLKQLFHKAYDLGDMDTAKYYREKGDKVEDMIYAIAGLNQCSIKLS